MLSDMSDAVKCISIIGTLDMVNMELTCQNLFRLTM
jgi:hypothetical protein